MRRLIPFAAVAVLVIAGCTSSGGAPATPEPPSASVPPESAAHTVAPTMTPEPIEVRVTFDGEACVYEGPTVFLDGTRVQFEFVPTDETADISALIVGSVDPGTSSDQIRSDYSTLKASEQPKWFHSTDYKVAYGPGSFEYTMHTAWFGPVGGHLVACLTSPETTDAAFFAELLAVAAGS